MADIETVKVNVSVDTDKSEELRSDENVRRGSSKKNMGLGKLNRRNSKLNALGALQKEVDEKYKHDFCEFLFYAMFLLCFSFATSFRYNTQGIK